MTMQHELRHHLDVSAGHTEGLRVVLAALCLTHPDPARLRFVLQELRASQATLLLSQPLSDEFLAALDSVVASVESLIPPA